MQEPSQFFSKFLALHHMFFQCLHSRVSSEHVHPRQGPILGLMLRRDGMSQADIVREMNVSAATVAVSLARLEKLGLIAREKNQQNQRANILSLTEKGRREALDLQQIMEEIGKTAMAGFTKTEVEQLEKHCARMMKNLRGKYPVKECGGKYAPHD